MTIVSLMIVLVILKAVNFFKGPTYVIIENSNFVCSDVEMDVEDNNEIIENIKENILYCFHYESYRRRERIIELLSELQNYDDPGEFLDVHPYICDYMFNRDVG